MAGPERDDIVQLLPRADDVPEGSIWDLDVQNHRRVRARNNMTTWRGPSEFFQWLTRTPSHTWLGRTVVVHRPPAETVQNAVLLRVSRGDVITLLGAPFWIWHTTDFLEGSFVVPAVIKATDNTTASEGTSVLCTFHVCSHRVPRTRTLWIDADARPNPEKMAPTTVATTTATTTRISTMTPIEQARTRIQTMTVPKIPTSNRKEDQQG